MVCWAGFAPHCQEVHLLSSRSPLCYGKMAFLDKNMGTPPPTSNQSMGAGAQMESSETRVSYPSGRLPLSPWILRLSPSAHEPASAKVGGPRVAPPGNSSSCTELQSPYQWVCSRPELLELGGGGGVGAWGGGAILTFLKQCADQFVHHYMMCVATVYVSTNACRYVHAYVWQSYIEQTCIYLCMCVGPWYYIGIHICIMCVLLSMGFIGYACFCVCLCICLLATVSVFLCECEAMIV